MARSQRLDAHRVLTALIVGSIVPAALAQHRASHPAPIVDADARVIPAAPIGGSDLPEGGGVSLPGVCDFFDGYGGYQLTSFENPPLSLVPFNGQPNPAGVAWISMNFFGAVSESLLLDAGVTPPAGVPQHGLAPERFAMSARGLGLSPYNAGLGVMASYEHGLFFPTISTPVLVSQDIYVETSDGQPRTTAWWSPVDFDSVSLYDRVYFGGTNLGGDLQGFANSQGVTDRFLSLAHLPGGGESFFASASSSVFPFPVDEWFTLVAHVGLGPDGQSGYSLWIKTEASATANPPFLDPRAASGDIPVIDGEPTGWINLFPGVGDNLATPQVREGIGIARNRFGDLAPTTGYLNQAPVFDSPTFNAMQYGWGFDDPQDPGFQPNNHYFANYCARGNFFQPACPPDLNGDGVVNGADLAIVLALWGADGAFTPADLNLDGVVDGVDLAIVLASWGDCF